MTYRIVELRPDVFSVEEYKPIAWFLWWIKDWQALHAYDCPAINEYSGTHVAEFTREQAEEHVAKLRAHVETQRLRKAPPEGYPRVVDQ